MALRKAIGGPAQPGMRCGRWALVRCLGSGGNGQVWLARDVDGGEEAAVKLLKPRKSASVPYARFRTEVAVMQSAQLPGVVRILDSFLPDEPVGKRPWYAMQLGNPLRLPLPPEVRFESKVASIARIADALAVLHERETAHRDIKPANLVVVDQILCLGDFGLATYRAKPPLTHNGELLGPRDTMPPEVRRKGAPNDPFKADVYSLAKTLWMLLTGTPELAFEGQYSESARSLSIAQCGARGPVGPLERLLSAATDHQPAQRPTMREFAEGLQNWLKISGNFEAASSVGWTDLLARLFVVQPSRAVWRDVQAIERVLSLLGRHAEHNHLFLPGGGGADLESATPSTREEGCLELLTNIGVYIVRPRRLTFEAFRGDPEWNYFRLEAADLDPTGLYDSYPSRFTEGVTDVPERPYADALCWNTGEYEGGPLPGGSRVVYRILRGASVIFHKSSLYNSSPDDTYDGRHDKMTAIQFRRYIRRNAEIYHKRKS